MATEKDDEAREPRIRDKRKIDPSTGEPRAAQPEDPAAPESADAETDAPGEPLEDDGASADVEDADELMATEDADVELSDDDLAQLLDAGERDLVAEYRERAARAEAELVNFRTRVERDRAANRDAVIAEVVRSLLPAIDDLDRADAHGDLTEGSPLALVAQKLRGGFDRYGLRRVGEKGEPFDPKLHEALVQLPSAEVEVETIADVIEPGYALGDRLVRAAKVAVSVPAG